MTYIIKLNFNAKTRHLVWDSSSEVEDVPFDLAGTRTDNLTAQIHVYITDTTNIIGLEDYDTDPNYIGRMEYDLFVPDPTGHTVYKPFELFTYYPPNTEENTSTQGLMAVELPNVILSHVKKGKLGVQVVFESKDGKRFSSIETLILDVKNAIDAQGIQGEAYPQVFSAFDNASYDNETKELTLHRINGYTEVFPIKDIVKDQLGTCAFKDIAVKDEEGHFKAGTVVELVTAPDGTGKIPLEALPMSVTEEHYEVYRHTDLILCTDAEVGDSASVTREDSGGSAKERDPTHYGQWYKLFGTGDPKILNNWIPMGIAINGAASTIVSKKLTKNTVVVSDMKGNIDQTYHGVSVTQLEKLTGITVNVQDKFDDLDEKDTQLDYKIEREAEKSVTDNNELKAELQTDYNTKIQNVSDALESEATKRGRDDTILQNHINAHEVRITNLESTKDNKLDKITDVPTGVTKVYVARGTESETVQEGIVATDVPSVSTLVLRSSTGGLTVNEGTADDDAVNKGQMDRAISAFDGRIDDLLERIQNETASRKADVGDLWERVGYNKMKSDATFKQFIADVGLTQVNYNNAEAVMLTYNSGKDVKSRISALETKEQADVDTLTANLNTEVTTRTNEVSALTTDLNEEITRSTGVDETHSREITDLKVKDDAQDTRLFNLERDLNTVITVNVPQITINTNSIEGIRTHIHNSIEPRIVNLETEVTGIKDDYTPKVMAITEWTADRTFKLNSTVVYNSSIYMSKKNDNTNHIPSEPSSEWWTAFNPTVKEKYKVSCYHGVFGTPEQTVYTINHGLDSYNFFYSVRTNTEDDMHYVDVGLRIIDANNVEVSFAGETESIAEKGMLINMMTCESTNIDDVSKEVVITEFPEAETTWSLLNTSGRTLYVQTYNEDGNEMTGDVTEEGADFSPIQVDWDGKVALDENGTYATKGTMVSIITSPQMVYHFDNQKVWRIQHGLGSLVAVQTIVTDDNQGLVEGDVTQTKDTVTVTFTTALSGYMVMVYPTKILRMESVNGETKFTHDLNRYVGVQFYSDEEGQAMLDVKSMDNTSFTVEFDHPFTGSVIVL